MAKTQDLPLNPAKISGLCNRLLCCLTYEYETYRSMKKGMPRIGKWINCDGTEYKVIRLIPLQDSVLAVSREGEETILTQDKWKGSETVRKVAEKPQIKKK
jgi:cell fate regulator YaaT (PSP1 superfamily)